MAARLECQREFADGGWDCLMPSQDMNARASGRIMGRQAETIAAEVSMWDHVVGVFNVSGRGVRMGERDERAS